MNILVSGASGFIGSHLCEYLIKKDNYVIALDNLITGKKENIEHLLKEKNFEFIEQDICKQLHLEKKLDQIYNLASPASPKDFEKLSFEIIMANSIGIKNMLELALKNNATFLQASSSEIYGDALKSPQKEDYFGNVNCFGPRSCYDEGKRFGETLCYYYAKKFNLDIKIARIFNTYGPKMRKDDGRAIPNFITQALANNPITIYGSGKQTRSFCYVSDMVEGLYKLMNSNYNKPINIGNPNEKKIIEVAKIIKKMTNSHSKIIFLKKLVDDPELRKPDISVAKKELKFVPKIKLEQGLKKTIEWFKLL